MFHRRLQRLDEVHRLGQLEYLILSDAERALHPMHASLLFDVLALLGASLIFVPLVEKGRLGPALGYILAGIFIGPFGLRLVTGPEDILSIGSLGTMFLLFVVGLELRPTLLWALRRTTLYGLVHVALAAAALTLLLLVLGVPTKEAGIAGLALSLSSPAVVWDTLIVRRQTSSKVGRATTGILLSHIIVAFAALWVLSGLAHEEGAVANRSQLVARFGWGAVALVASVLIGRYVLGHAFRWFAASRNSSVLTAGALFVVLLSAVAMETAGLEAPLGAFIAGVMLADSEYRHEIEQRVEPLRGLFVGLLLIAVGLSIDWVSLVDNLGFVLGLTVATLMVKWGALMLLSKRTEMGSGSAAALALSLAQCGELSIAVFATTRARTGSWLSLLTDVAALSMCITPLLLRLLTARQRLAHRQADADADANQRQQRIFISYSRRDAAKALALLPRLESEEFEVAIDTRDLPYGEKWQKELEHLIRQADVVIWLVSPASIQSRWCAFELQLVQRYGKRLVPVLLERVTIDSLPPVIGEIQLLPRDGVFEAKDEHHLQMLAGALRQDHIWIRQHTRLTERAHEWDSRGRGVSSLLYGEDLVEAERWRDEQPHRAPSPDPAVLDLIHSSRLHASTTQQLSGERLSPSQATATTP